MTTKAQSIDEVFTRLEALTCDDPESAHVDAENFLLDALILLGQPQIASAFIKTRDRCHFWYA